MDGAGSTVAAIDAVDDKVAVWWIYVGPKRARLHGRLVGAWIVPDHDAQTLESLLRARVWWPSSRAVPALPERGEPVLDIAATLAAVNSERAKLDAAFHEVQVQRTRSTRMIEPEWPMFPQPVTPEELPATRGIEPPRRALTMARWLSMLCSQWEELEEQRLARPMLRKLAEGSARPLPLVMT
ncbi:MAG: hypothetical protein Q7V58_09360 [Actinomycetota bacterium]|nr:hypothetical protein [Actinomycetota bacterium]